MCPLAKAVLVELPGLGQHRAVPGAGHGHGGGLPGVRLCGRHQASQAAHRAASSDSGPRSLSQGVCLYVRELELRGDSGRVMCLFSTHILLFVLSPKGGSL